MDETVELYKSNAEQCLAWARKAKDEENRIAFVNLAGTWLNAAACRLKQDALSFVPYIDSDE